jgi:hypothetical protein
MQELEAAKNIKLNIIFIEIKSSGVDEEAGAFGVLFSIKIISAEISKVIARSRH